MSLIEIQNVVFACPGDTPESYEAGARPLALFYAELLGMRIVREDWYLIEDDLHGLRLGFGDGPVDYQPPRWPDPEFPQQMHLDIAVADLDAADRRVIGIGASRLKDNDTFRVYADPAGHPFCLYRDESADRTHIARVVLDCLSPRSLAAFYAPLVDMPTRLLDTPERVAITHPDARGPALAFQHAIFPAPRWPDGAYPQQVHLDLQVPDAEMQAAQSLATQLGAIPLKTVADSLHIYTDPAGHPFCLY